MDELDIKLAAAAKACSEDAVKRAFAAGLSVLVMRDGKLVRLFPDGRENVEASPGRDAPVASTSPGRDAVRPSAIAAFASIRVSSASAPYRKGRRFRVVAGPNGSGKSTLRTWLAHDYAVNFYSFLNADDVNAELRRSGTSFVPFAVTNDELRDFAASSTYPDEVRAPFADGRIRIDGECVRFADGTVNSYTVALWIGFLQSAFVVRGLSFSQETVFSHASKIEALKAARAAGYRTYLYFVATEDPAINASRVSNRAALGGHAVPADKIAERYGRSLANVRAALPYLSRAYFFDNSGSVMRFVAEYGEDGGISVKDAGPLPAWLGFLRERSGGMTLCHGSNCEVREPRLVKPSRNQLVFASEKALSFVRFQGSEVVHG